MTQDINVFLNVREIVLEYKYENKTKIYFSNETY